MKRDHHSDQPAVLIHSDDASSTGISKPVNGVYQNKSGLLDRHVVLAWEAPPDQSPSRSQHRVPSFGRREQILSDISTWKIPIGGQCIGLGAR
jgi:hypothetical protein